eukprot:GHVU01055528.1.p1 GENE.GHVU01055528.1~~GHVU01055528.1.p1  ORF type:complete len:466 (-),score=124.77 GHVU01055528.1:68-1465(-)
MLLGCCCCCCCCCLCVFQLSAEPREIALPVTLPTGRSGGSAAAGDSKAADSMGAADGGNVIVRVRYCSALPRPDLMKAAESSQQAAAEAAAVPRSLSFDELEGSAAAVRKTTGVDASTNTNTTAHGGTTHDEGHPDHPSTAAVVHRLPGDSFRRLATVATQTSEMELDTARPPAAAAADDADDDNADAADDHHGSGQPPTVKAPPRDAMGGAAAATGDDNLVAKTSMSSLASSALYDETELSYSHSAAASSPQAAQSGLPQSSVPQSYAAAAAAAREPQPSSSAALGRQPDSSTSRLAYEQQQQTSLVVVLEAVEGLSGGGGGQSTKQQLLRTTKDGELVFARFNWRDVLHRTESAAPTVPPQPPQPRSSSSSSSFDEREALWRSRFTVPYDPFLDSGVLRIHVEAEAGGAPPPRQVRTLFGVADVQLHPTAGVGESGSRQLRIPLRYPEEDIIPGGGEGTASTN